MNARQILIVENVLLGQAVKNLLGRLGVSNLVGVTPQDEAALIEIIGNTKPDVLVMDKATGITDPDGLLCLLKDVEQLRVVVVGIDDNLVQVYDKRQIQITQSKDLVAIVCS